MFLAVGDPVINLSNATFVESEAIETNNDAWSKQNVTIKNQQN